MLNTLEVIGGGTTRTAEEHSSEVNSHTLVKIRAIAATRSGVLHA
jgi:hypothetical protein